VIKSLAVAVGLALVACAGVGLAADDKGGAEPAAAKKAAAPAADPTDWAMNATIIEACSCPMFCQCYFSTEPAAHSDAHAGHAGHGEAGGEHYCKFNNAYKVNKGHYGDVKLDGATFWLAGDLGDDFSKGQMNWAVLTFDPSVKPEQRAGIITAMRAAYPVTWKSFTVGKDASVEWNGGKDRAVAKLNGGKDAEVALNRWPGSNAAEPVVIHNLKYWGAPRNDGFIMMPNEVQAYRAGDKPFEFKGTNGFMITLDINSRDVAAADAKEKAKM
jgi:Protein of unknown function (DUF1326)